ncbi:MFS transporter [Streptomyces sp. CA-111067]|uniref:MFS transporter n=1 Tax=Streptomyces sp. CA-111067 TaxID=3240046 RepID=UPI003D95B2A5
MRELLRHRDARVYLIAQTLSIIGDSAIWLAMGIYAKMLTGSNSDAGLTFLAFILGSAMAPFSGMLADRVRRRTLLVWVNVAASAEVCLLLAAGPGRVWVIYPVMFGYGALGSVILSAQTALLPRLVPEELLGPANTVLQVAEQGFRIFTPLLGAGLLAWVGPKPVILIDAGTFLVAAAATAAVRHRESKPERSEQSWSHEFTAGMRYLGGDRLLRRLLVAGVMSLLVFGMIQSVQYAVVDDGLHRSPAFLGVLESAMGFGAIAGAVASEPMLGRFGERKLVVAGLLAMAAAFAPLLMTGVLVLVVLAMLLFGAGLLAVNVGAITLIQRRTPPELLGRVDAAVSLAVLIPQSISIAVGAALVAVVDYRILLLAMAAGTVLAAAHLMRGSAGEEAAAGSAAVPAARPADGAAPTGPIDPKEPSARGTASDAATATHPPDAAG